MFSVGSQFAGLSTGKSRRRVVGWEAEKKGCRVENAEMQGRWPVMFLTGNLLQLRSDGEDHGTYVTGVHNLVISE